MKLIDIDAFRKCNGMADNCVGCERDAKECNYDRIYTLMDFCTLLDCAPIVNQWIPCSERLPEENECVGNVWKYYLIQDEYEDMHVAHLSSRGWKTIESVKALECDVVAWMPLPDPYMDGQI